MSEILSSALILLGAFLILAGAVGVARFGDFFSRVHAASVPSTVGVAIILLASAVEVSAELGQPFLKPVVAVIVLFLAVPLGTEMLARAAYITNLMPSGTYVQDEGEARQVEHKEAVE